MSQAPAPNDRPSPALAFDALRRGSFRSGDLTPLSDLSRSDFRTFVPIWDELDDATRQTAIKRMVELAEERVELSFNRIFRLALGDASAPVRQLAVAGLWEDESEDLVPLLLDLVESDESVDVRAESLQLLGKFSERAADGKIGEAISSRIRDVLLGLAGDESEHGLVQRRALEAVASLGEDDDVSDLIRDAFDHDDAAFRASALFAMGKTAARSWLPTVIGEFESDDAEPRFEAARAAGMIGDADAVPALAELGIDHDPEVRHAAIASLGQIGGPAATRVLRALAERAVEADRVLIEDALEEASGMRETAFESRRA